MGTHYHGWHYRVDDYGDIWYKFDTLTGAIVESTRNDPTLWADRMRERDKTDPKSIAPSDRLRYPSVCSWHEQSLDGRSPDWFEGYKMGHEDGVQATISLKMVGSGATQNELFNVERQLKEAQQVAFNLSEELRRADVRAKNHKDQLNDQARLASGAETRADYWRSTAMQRSNAIESWKREFTEMMRQRDNAIAESLLFQRAGRRTLWRHFLDTVCYGCF